MIIGYSRISSADQNLARQKKILTDFGCEHIIEEKMSGAKKENRKELQNLLKRLRFQDVLVVTDLSRLARSLQDLLAILKELEALQVKFVSIKENIDTRESNPYSRFMIQIMGAIAEFERELIKERQMEGIMIAKKEGKFQGRKLKYHAGAKGADKIIYDTIVSGLLNNDSVMDIHKRTGVSRNTIYVIKRELSAERVINPLES